ncbi:carbonic anhydrase, partial [bacterium]|nr:carbonic anhydrase [bacterium]
QIQPAIDQVEGHAGDRSSNNAKFVDDVIKQNVLTTVSDIRKRSPVLLKLEKDRKIKIVGGVYSLATGKVTLLD